MDILNFFEKASELFFAFQLATGNWTFKVTRFGSRLQFMVKMAHYFAADFTEAKNEREKKIKYFLLII